MEPKFSRKQIREYRDFLNATNNPPHRNGRYRQRTRKYGDYLYHQDREQFMVCLQEWVDITARKSKAKEE